MTAITVRNIPDETAELIKALSKKEKRSMNNEILVLLEEGLYSFLNKNRLVQNDFISQDAQTAIWENLCGKWKDNRKTDEIIHDIYSNRTLGREFKI